MITPLEIQEKEFSRGIKGFKEEEVNEFLDQITLDLEALLDENYQLRLQNEQLQTELSKFRSAEHSVIDTLETAKALMSDISASAEKRAQILLKNAELEAETMIREASEAVARMNDENAQIRNKLVSFRTKYRDMLEAEMRQLDRGVDDLFAELSMDDLSDIPDAPGMPDKSHTATYAKPNLDKTMLNIK